MFSTKEEYLEFISSTDLDSLPKEALDEVTKFLEAEAIEMAQQSFYHYVLLLGPTRIDGFETGRHIQKICEELQELGENIWKKTGLTPRKMISLPPGGMKSELCSRLFPSWLLGRWPNIRIILVGHGIEFAKDEFGAKIRDIVRSEEYKAIFPETELREDKQTAGRFLTKSGGEMVCTSLEAKIAGRRGHIVICDDALVEDDALSKPIRMRLVGQYMPNVRSRLLMSPDCAELQVGTRWTQGDLFDYLEKEDRKSGSPWKIIKIPALLDDEASEYLRQEGDKEGYLGPGTSFWPEFHPTNRLEMLRNSYVNNMPRWNAVYMQNPTPESGQILNPPDFKHWKEAAPPACHTIIVTADTAYTKNTQSDYTAFQMWGLFNYQDHTIPDSIYKTHAILLNAKKGKWDYPELVNLFMDMYQKEQIDYFILEERSSGLALVPDLQKRGLPVYPWKTEKDKIMRMQAAAPLVKSGIIWIPMPEDDSDACAKSTDFVSEICAFPGGNHDDVPDAFSQFLLFCRDNNVLTDQSYMHQEVDEEDEDDFTVYGSYTSAYLR